MFLCTNAFLFSEEFLGGGVNDKHIRFNAFVEQLYLHNDYYHKGKQVLEKYNIQQKAYAIVRYIAYDAHHDLATHPLSDEAKKRIVSEIAKHIKVFVSLEENTSDPFYDEYKLRISPWEMHDLEANALFLVTEGATMASESFVLGVPFIYLNPLRCGSIDYQCEYYSDRSFQTTDEETALTIVRNLIHIETDSDTAKQEVEKLTINPTDFLKWFVEKYPESVHRDFWPSP